MFRIATASPLHNLPAELSERQIILLDGIRYSANMAGIAVDRLWEVLRRIDANLDAADGTDTAEAALFAWSIVDAAHRMGQLVEELPGLKKKGWPDVFRRRLAECEWFRNAWQHQRGESHEAVLRRDQAFGAIGWVKHDGKRCTGRWFFVVAGSELKGSQWFARPSKSVPRVGTRRIRLLYGERSLYLSRLVRDMFWAVSQLEQEIEAGRVRLVGEQVNQRRGQDFMFEMSMTVLVSVPPPAPPSATCDQKE